MATEKWCCSARKIGNLTIISLLATWTTFFIHQLCKISKTQHASKPLNGCCVLKQRCEFYRQYFIDILSKLLRYNEKSSSLSTFINIVLSNFLVWSALAHADSMPTSVLSWREPHHLPDLFFFFFCLLCKNLDPSHLENIRDGVMPTFLSDAVIETWGHRCSSAVFGFNFLCVCASRVMGKSHPVSGDPPAPAPTAPWAAMDVTPRPAPPRITADKVSAADKQKHPIIISIKLLWRENPWVCIFNCGK